jgi:hypothetical protein
VVGDTACTALENLPAPQAVHRFAVPSLYRPAAHAVQALAQAGLSVVRSDILGRLAVFFDGSSWATHREQAVWAAPLPVPGGHSWQAVPAPGEGANVPGRQGRQPVVALEYSPGRHALHGPTPSECCSGGWHSTQALVSGWW